MAAAQPFALGYVEYSEDDEIVCPAGAHAMEIVGPPSERYV